MDAVEETLADLERMPGMGHRYESARRQLAGIRVWSVKGFPNHLIFYRPTKEGIEVLHVLHGARDIDAAFARELQKGDL